MFLKNIKNAFKSLWRNKFFSVINIIGLSIGLAGAFILMLYILKETGYNRCHLKRNNIYRVLETHKDMNLTMPYAPYYFSEYLLKDFPEVKKASRLGYIYGVTFLKGEENIHENRVFAADPSVFDIFTLPVIRGNKEDFLKDPSSIVITESIAKKYFPNDDALGKEMQMKLNGQNYHFKVDGIIKDIPKKSTLFANIFCHISFVWERSKQYFPDDKIKYSWKNANYQTYILLPDGYNVKQLEKKLPDFIKKYSDDDNIAVYTFQPLTDIYFHSRNLNNCRKWGDLQKLYYLLVVAFLILFVAAANYIILSTAQSVTRFKEIGVRKTLGANRQMLINQIFTESVVVSVLAIPVSILILYFSFPFVNEILNTNLQLNLLTQWKALAGMFIITFSVGIISGGYLALFLSKLNPVEALRNISIINNSKSWLRFALIILQIIVFVVLLVFVQNVANQIQFAETSDLGYDKANLIKLFIKVDFLKNHPAFIEELKENPDILHVSAASYTPPAFGWSKIRLPHVVDTGKLVIVEALDVYYDFSNTLGLRIIEGRSFSKKYGTDSVDAVMVSKSAVKALGLPQHPVNIRLKRNDKKSYNIIGVFDDIYMRSFKEKIVPMIINLSDEYLPEMIVRYREGTDSTTIAFLKESFRKVAPEKHFDYSTVSDFLKYQYKNEIQLEKTLDVFALLTIFISMLGLFALSVFLIKQKTKSIGIRKVLGASTKDIIKLVAKEFMMMALIANIIAFPLAAWLVNSWLKTFAYHIEFQVLPYLIAFFASLVLVFATVAISAYKTASTNPAESIKYQE